MGFTGLSLEIIELDRVLPGFILFHWVLMGFIGVPMGFTGF